MFPFSSSKNTSFISICILSFFIIFALFYLINNYFTIQTAGWIDYATLENIHFKAKLDTGAATCSLDAKIIKTFEKNNNIYVTFETVDDNKKKHIITAKQTRVSSIKLKTKGVQLRPTVLLKVQVGNIARKVEVNLTDRSHFQYRLLVGRNYLASNFLIDSSKKFIFSKE